MAETPSLETIVKKDGKSFRANQDAAIKELRRVTKYNGPLDDGDKRNTYFSTYEVSPVDVGGRPIGCEITYQLASGKTTSGGSKTTGGCGPVDTTYDPL